MSIFTAVRRTATEAPDATAQIFRDPGRNVVRRSYRTLIDEATSLASAFREIGVVRGTRVGIVSENRPEWLICDLALLGLGAIDVPRPGDATGQEIDVLLDHAGCELCIAENVEIAERVAHRRSAAKALRRLIVIDPSEPDSPDSDEDQDFEENAGESGGQAEGASQSRLDVLRSSSGITIQSLEELAAGGERSDDLEAELAACPDELTATILYTSGTTGEPKGAVLTHESFLFQIERVASRVPIELGDVTLSILPIWHSFERACEYIVLAAGGAIAYSKPTIRSIHRDLRTFRPHWMTGVPRLLDGLRHAYENEILQRRSELPARIAHYYARLADRVLGRRPVWTPRSDMLRRVALVPLFLLLIVPGTIARLVTFSSFRRQFGRHFRAAISGGGKLPSHTDRFFRAAGITLLEGYGLTEAGPILAVRSFDRPVVGTVGTLLPDIESKIVGSDGSEVDIGECGNLYVRGASLMSGYYRNPELTAEVLERGWLNTGDIVMRSRAGELSIQGRAKETIVLSGGENIEPAPIEQRLCTSPLVRDCMIVGQDRKFLGALIVPDLEHAAAEGLIMDAEVETEALRDRIRQEIAEHIGTASGYRSHEQIYRFAIVSTPFTEPAHLTHTGKKRRAQIELDFRATIESVYE